MVLDFIGNHGFRKVCQKLFSGTSCKLLFWWHHLHFIFLGFLRTPGVSNHRLWIGLILVAVQICRLVRIIRYWSCYHFSWVILSDFFEYLELSLFYNRCLAHFTEQLLVLNIYSGCWCVFWALSAWLNQHFQLTVVDAFEPWAGRFLWVTHREQNVVNVCVSVLKAALILLFSAFFHFWLPFIHLTISIIFYRLLNVIFQRLLRCLRNVNLDFIGHSCRRLIFN